MKQVNPTVALHLAVLALTFIAFILLTIITFSVPISSSLYFLHASEANGVRFGIWGWCLDENGVCMSPMKLGYTWEPQVAVPVTGALILYPIAAIATFLTMIALIPAVYIRTSKTGFVFRVFSLASFMISAFAFVFMIAMWGVAKKRFEKAGFEARYGPLPWISLVASFILSLVTTIASFKIGPSESQLIQAVNVEESRFSKERPRRPRPRTKH